MNFKNNTRQNVYPLPLAHLQDGQQAGDDAASNDSKVLKSLDSAQDLRMQGSMFRPTPSNTIGTQKIATLPQDQDNSR